MPTFKGLAGYADAVPGATDRLLFETAAGLPRGVAPASLPGAGGIAVEDEGTEILAAAVRLNFAGAGVTVADAGSNEATVTIPGSGVAEVRKTLHVVGGADGTYYFDLSSPAWTITSLVEVSTGSRACNAAVRIDGTNVTSLSAVGVSTTKGTTNATGANVVAAGDEVTLVLSGGSGTGDVIATLVGTLG